MRDALAALLLLSASPAVAQQTNCITTGYGAQQHLWCNTTPAPDTSGYQQLQQSEANFAATLAQTAAAVRASQAQADAQAQVARMIAAFAAGPGHERFAELSDYMAVLIRSGRATNLQDAYTLAAAEHPAR